VHQKALFSAKITNFIGSGRATALIIDWRRHYSWWLCDDDDDGGTRYAKPRV